MSILMNDLDTLEDYSCELLKMMEDTENTIEKYISKTDENELHTSVLILLDDAMNSNPNILVSEDYDETIYGMIEEEVREMLEYLVPDSVRYKYKIEYERKIRRIVEDIEETYYENIPPRCYGLTTMQPSGSITSDKSYKNMIDKKLKIINEKDALQPPQRTTGWYETRYNLLSASSIGKCFSTQGPLNKLIYDKCEPLNTSKYSSVNINSSLHWGQKYEPISQQYYEYKYDTTIREYGCIIHTKYNFLGASPDGINVKRDHPNYGRMLEIKNIVNREITGIPKPDYWVQMQIQMECCDLEECDFLECRFIEYEDETAFYRDGEEFHLSEDGCYKGVYIQFFEDQRPFYEYPPKFIMTRQEYNEWYDQTIHKHHDKTWIKNIYWKLDEVSCVLVPRNRFWMERNFDYLQSIWDIILKERKSGNYILRKSKPKTPKSLNNSSNIVKVSLKDHFFNAVDHELNQNNKEEKEEKEEVITQEVKKDKTKNKDKNKDIMIINIDI
jgi:putative phage-type endonuclease